MKFEFEEYIIDENGNEVCNSRYEVDAMHFYRTLETLDKAVQDGAISSYSYAAV